MRAPAIKLQDVAKSAAIPIALVLVILIPFLGKAFTIDDMTFLLEARHALVDPVHPAAFDMVFDGERIRLSRYMASGPVMAYMLTPVVNSTKAEYFAHLIQLALCVAGIVATASLALRFGMNRVQAGVATLLVAASPAVLGMTSTAMPDIPAMAFSIMGMERFVAWYQQRKLHAGIAAALLLGIAFLSRSHTLLLLPVGALLALVANDHAAEKERGVGQRFVDLLPLIIAALIVAAVSVISADPQGRDLATATVLRVHADKIFFNLPSYLLHWAVEFPLALLWPIARGVDFLKIRRTLVAFLIAVPLAYTGDDFNHGLVWGVILLMLLTLSIDVMFDIALDAKRRGDKLQIILLLWLLAPCVAVVYIQLPPKLLLFAAPAMGILVARRADWSRVAGIQKWYSAVVLACGFVLGILVLRTDREFAEIGRFGAKVVAQQIATGKKVWFDGSWGFHWYSLEAGAEPVARTAPFPKPGDIVVTGPQGQPMPKPKGTVIYRKVFSDPGGRIQSDGAGFFTNGAGPLPWNWGKSEIARIEVWRVLF